MQSIIIPLQNRPVLRVNRNLLNCGKNRIYRQMNYVTVMTRTRLYSVYPDRDLQRSLILICPEPAQCKRANLHVAPSGSAQVNHTYWQALRDVVCTTSHVNTYKLYKKYSIYAGLSGVFFFPQTASCRKNKVVI